MDRFSEPPQERQDGSPSRRPTGQIKRDESNPSTIASVFANLKPNKHAGSSNDGAEDYEKGPEKGKNQDKEDPYTPSRKLAQTLQREGLSPHNFAQSLRQEELLFGDLEEGGDTSLVDTTSSATPAGGRKRKSPSKQTSPNKRREGGGTADHSEPPAGSIKAKRSGEPQASQHPAQKSPAEHTSATARRQEDTSPGKQREAIAKGPALLVETHKPLTEQRSPYNQQPVTSSVNKDKAKAELIKAAEEALEAWRGLKPSAPQPISSQHLIPPHSAMAPTVRDQVYATSSV